MFVGANLVFALVLVLIFLLLSRSIFSPFSLLFPVYI